MQKQVQRFPRKTILEKGRKECSYLCFFLRFLFKDHQILLSFTWLGSMEQSQLLFQHHIDTFNKQSSHSIYFLLLNHAKVQTRQSLLESLQCWRTSLAFSIARVNKHRACIPVVHRGLAASISGNIREILSTNFISSVHIKR